MGALLNLDLNFEREECYTCGVVFWMPSQFQENRRKDKKNFFCPSGHHQAYIESEADRLRKELEKQKKRTEWAEEQAKNARADAERAELRRRAQFGENTKLRKRISNGVCPCCRRNFVSLGRHLKKMHPDFVPESDA